MQAAWSEVVGGCDPVSRDCPKSFPMRWGVGVAVMLGGAAFFPVHPGKVPFVHTECQFIENSWLWDAKFHWWGLGNAWVTWV